MPTYNDNSVPYGSQVVTIGATGFVAENIALQVPSQITERRNETGDPNGQVIIEQFNNGTATLQLATTLTVPPTIGATFTLTRNGGATIVCVLSQIGEPQAQFDIRKVSVNFRKRYGS